MSSTTSHDRRGIAGILLAAGRSTRMKQQKLLLPWTTGRGEMPVVASAFDCIAPFCETMIVVVGQNENEIIAALQDRRFETVRTTDEVVMFASITSGVRAVDDTSQTQIALLHPADHPYVNDQTIRQLFEHSRKQPGMAIMPTYNNHGGHPVLIPLALFQRILDFSGEGGLRQFWIDHPEMCVRVPVDDSNVILDIDTPEEYERRLEPRMNTDQHG